MAPVFGSRVTSCTHSLSTSSRTTAFRVRMLSSTSVVVSTTKSEDGQETTSEIPRTLMTLAVKQQAAQKLFWGNNNGILSVGLINDKTEVKLPSSETNEPNLFK